MMRRSQTFAAIVAEHGAGPDDDSRKDRALTLGLVQEASRAYRGCNACHGMSWRRHWNGCVGCGRPFQAERVEVPVPDIQSSAGNWGEAP